MCHLFHLCIRKLFSRAFSFKFPRIKTSFRTSGKYILAPVHPALYIQVGFLHTVPEPVCGLG